MIRERNIYRAMKIFYIANIIFWFFFIGIIYYEGFNVLADENLNY